MASESSGGWFVTGPAGPVGPYDVEAIKSGIAAGGITGETPVWREGRPAWDKLGDVPELAGLLEGAPAAGAAAAAAASAAAAPAGHAAANGSGGAPRRGAVAAVAAPSRTAAAAATAASAPAAAAAADPSDPLAAFQAEISAIEAEAAEAEAAAEAAEAEAAGAGPSTPEELEFEDDDGTWYVWDAALRKYVPKGEEGAPVAGAGAGGESGGGGGAEAAGAGAYDVDAMTYAGDDEVVPTLAAVKAAEEAAAAKGKKGGAGGADDAAERKRKRDAIVTAHKEKMAKQEAAKKEQQQQQQQGWFELKNNTSVYVNGLPFDTNEKEVAAVFSKCGLIKEGPDAQPRIKLYRDESGGLKGDALVTYLKAPSVQLATTLLDGTPLREGGKPMSVSEAKFEMKGGAYQAKQDGAAAAQQPRKRGKGKGGRGGNAKAQLDRLERKLGWGGFDDKLPPEKVTVILTGMFDPLELEAQLGAAAELEEDVLAECTKLGPVEKVRVFKGNPQGAVSVRFRDEDGARAVLARMDGRFFGGRRIAAAMWDGVTNYNVKVRESAEEEAARLERYTRELEAREAAAAAAAAAAAGAGAIDAAAAGGGDAAAVEGAAG